MSPSLTVDAAPETERVSTGAPRPPEPLLWSAVFAGHALTVGGRVGLLVSALTAYALLATPALSRSLLLDVAAYPAALLVVALGTAAAAGLAAWRYPRARQPLAAAATATLAAGLMVAAGVTLLHPWWYLGEVPIALSAAEKRAALGLLGRSPGWLALASGAALGLGYLLRRRAAAPERLPAPAADRCFGLLSQALVVLGVVLGAVLPALLVALREVGVASPALTGSVLAVSELLEALASYAALPLLLLVPDAPVLGLLGAGCLGLGGAALVLGRRSAAWRRAGVALSAAAVGAAAAVSLALGAAVAQLLLCV